MKGRLITNGVLSVLMTSFWICFFIIQILKNWNLNFNWSMLWPIIIGLSIADFVIGIVTLSMKKHKAAAGLTIASGVLSIINGLFLGSLFFVNAIVSFIGVAKINSFQKTRQLE